MAVFVGLLLAASIPGLTCCKGKPKLVGGGGDYAKVEEDLLHLMADNQSFWPGVEMVKVENKHPP